MKVAFQCVAGVESFSVTVGDGSSVTVVKGKTFATGDPKVISELDGATHAVERVKEAE